MTVYLDSSCPFLAKSSFELIGSATGGDGSGLIGSSGMVRGGAS